MLSFRAPVRQRMVHSPFRGSNRQQFAVSQTTVTVEAAHTKWRNFVANMTAIDTCFAYCHTTIACTMISRSAGGIHVANSACMTIWSACATPKPAGQQWSEALARGTDVHLVLLERWLPVCLLACCCLKGALHLGSGDNCRSTVASVSFRTQLVHVAEISRCVLPAVCRCVLPTVCLVQP